MQHEVHERHHLFTGLQTDRVTKGDGRYLIYYHWPESAPASPSDERDVRGEPNAEPWSPETRPDDV